MHQRLRHNRWISKSATPTNLIESGVNPTCQMKMSPSLKGTNNSIDNQSLSGTIRLFAFVVGFAPDAIKSNRLQR